ncbi:formylglycine-generating enzyme family protein [Lignipirellula cremea]|uniref:Serine/threonine-protein kinase pkn1 n=1 Tax=Lignipirellula cremea TaxID=2528010 RepID=A0A518DTI9_9BACT|nr:SUMF1/EgtB/PvdO family nonheme iron enzyme [Lignipirellula cremea]QDU95162.1 Serine/threonine-protein kinase pkn1 [Lignipirellula cremea]
MNSGFNPYHKWLGISPEQQPPNHYQLLGIPQFESDGDVISNGADQRMAHLRSFQNGKQAAHCQRLLNEVSAARVCLLRDDQKAAYDAQLRAKESAAAAKQTAPPAAFPVVVPVATSPPGSRPAARLQPMAPDPLAIAADATPSQRRPSAKASRLSPLHIGLATGGLLGVVLLAAILFYAMPSPEATMTFQLAIPDVEVAVNGTDFAIARRGTQVDGPASAVELPAGDYSLTVKRGAKVFETEKFVVGPGDRVLVAIDSIPGGIRVRQNEALIGTFPIDKATQVATTQQPPVTTLADSRPPVARVKPPEPVRPPESPITAPVAPVPVPTPSIPQPPLVVKGASYESGKGWPPGAPAPAVIPFDAAGAKARQQAWADYAGVPVERIFMLPGGEPLKMILIPPGEFMMGDLPVERQSQVILSRLFWIAETEVTIAQWDAVVKTPSRMASYMRAKLTPRCPQVGSNQLDMLEYCQTLTRLEQDSLPNGYRFDLPTEAQWEFASRAGADTKFFFGEDAAPLNEYAWLRETAGSDERLSDVQEVAQKKPNPFGLYDIYGNAAEAVLDWADHPLPRGVDPLNDEAARYGGARGGSVRAHPQESCSTHRGRYEERVGHQGVGFRPVLTVPAVQYPAPVLHPDGGRDWPADAPALARAPFTESQARNYQAAWSKYLKQPVERTVALPNGVELKLTLIPPGDFMMGASQLDEHHGKLLDESPQHQVYLTQPFYLATFETTQSQWGALMSENPSATPGPQLPVHGVDDALVQTFLEKLNQSSPQTSMEFVLPTEAQWEFACRAGTAGPFFYSSQDDIGDYGWTIESKPRELQLPQAQPPGQKRPNPFSLYDMYGNVSELCADGYAPDYYQQSPANDPAGPSQGKVKVARGGHAASSYYNARSAVRDPQSARSSPGGLGFRIALVMAGE